MTGLPTTLNANQHRSNSGIASKNVFCLILVLTLGLMDCLVGGLPAFAQNIQFTPSAVSITVPKGGTGTGTISLNKSDTAQHTYFISASQSWIWLNPPYGSTQTISTETDVLTVTVNTASMGMAAGTYSGTIYIGQSGPGVSTTWRIPVTATVTATGTTPPPSTTPPPPSTTPPPPSTTPPPPSAFHHASAGDTTASAAKRVFDPVDSGLSGGPVAVGPERIERHGHLQPAKVRLDTERL